MGKVHLNGLSKGPPTQEISKRTSAMGTVFKNTKPGKYIAESSISTESMGKVKWFMGRINGTKEAFARVKSMVSVC
jgi:hypothetical protein